MDDIESKREIDDKREASRAHNAALRLDFDDPHDADEMTADRRRRGGPPSFWTEKLTELRDGVERGEGKAGALYLIGQFRSRSGASATRHRLLHQSPHLIPDADGGFLLTTTQVMDEGAVAEGFQSELYAAYLPAGEGDAEGDEGEGGDEGYEQDDHDDHDDGDLFDDEP